MSDNFEKNENPKLSFRRIGIIGLGMLGGSVALAAQKYAGVEKVIAVGRDPERLAKAQKLGIIHDFSTSAKEFTSEVDLFVVCSPVNTIADHIIQLVEEGNFRGLITDVGSTKQNICSRVEEHFSGPHRFVAAHPLAGSEKEGFENSDSNLFRKAKVILAVSPNNAGEDIEQVDQFWKSLGGHTTYCAAGEHDQILAFTSHLPHLLATGLINTIQEKDFRLSATGLSSTTRIAEGKPDIWAPIFLDNRENILVAVKEFQRRLQALVQTIENQNYEHLASLLDDGKGSREKLVALQNRNDRD